MTRMYLAPQFTKMYAQLRKPACHIVDYYEECKYTVYDVEGMRWVFARERQLFEDQQNFRRFRERVGLMLVIALVVMLLAGCATSFTQPVASRRPPPRPMVKWCETRAGYRECWMVPQEEVQRAIDVLNGP